MVSPANFLVTGVNGDLGDSIGRTLRDCYPGARLAGTDVKGQWPGASVYDDVHILPLASDPDYLPSLLRLWETLNRPITIPASVPETLLLARNIQHTGDLDPVIANPNLVMTFSDKLATSTWFAENGLTTLSTTTLTNSSELEPPVLVKPRFGSGSSGVSVYRDAAPLRERAAEPDAADYVAQRYIPGAENEFTCALFRHDDDIRFLIMRRRLDGSSSVYIRTEHDPAIASLLRSIADAADLRGSINVQLRLWNEVPYVFEINPRFSSTVRMRHLLGFEDLYWTIEARRGALPDARPVALGREVYRMPREIVVPSA